jgi:hypothetical protein
MELEALVEHHHLVLLVALQFRLQEEQDQHWQFQGHLLVVLAEREVVVILTYLEVVEIFLIKLSVEVMEEVLY